MLNALKQFLTCRASPAASGKRLRYAESKALYAVKLQGTKQPSGSRKAGAFGADLKPLAQVQLQVRQTLRGHMAKVYAMQWSADSLSLVSASQDGKLIVWDPRENNKVRSCQICLLLDSD